MSCNMCRNGWTAMGKPCPNGCAQTSPEPKGDFVNSLSELPIYKDSRYREEHRFDDPLPSSNQRDRYRGLSTPVYPLDHPITGAPAQRFHEQQKERFARYRKILEMYAPLKLSEEEKQWLQKLSDEEKQQLRHRLTSMQRAHWEWCDAVLAAQTNEGATDAPDVLLIVAMEQLTRVIARVGKIMEACSEPDGSP